jgi:hypothetical protein
MIYVLDRYYEFNPTTNFQFFFFQCVVNFSKGNIEQVYQKIIEIMEYKDDSFITKFF